MDWNDSQKPSSGQIERFTYRLTNIPYAEQINKAKKTKKAIERKRIIKRKIIRIESIRKIYQLGTGLVRMSEVQKLSIIPIEDL